MEEFRPIIIDSIVLRIVNTRALTQEDFEPSAEQEGLVHMKQQAIKLFLQQYEERVQATVIHPVANTRATYRRCFELQARQLARIVTGQQRTYQPFLVK
jgi:CRISPR-associated protein Cas1